MPTARVAPLALEPYLRLPAESSLTLLTGTVGVNASFLATRFVGSALQTDQHDDDDDRDAGVLLITWLRDSSFWKQEIRRGSVSEVYICSPLSTTNCQHQGLDTTRLSQLGKFAAVDCFSDPTWPLVETEKRILSALALLSDTSSTGRPKKITLILDAPDILLATSSTTAAALNTFLLTLRSQECVHHAIVSLSADGPFLSAALPDSADTRSTPIEVETASFATTQAHAARLVLSVRGLDTGAATDISGVLRATRGGDHPHEADVKEGELLYLVQRDGNLKVFERGSG